MKVSAKGTSGDLLSLVAHYAIYSDLMGEVAYHINGYEVSIWDGKKEVTYPHITSSDIKFED